MMQKNRGRLEGKGGKAESEHPAALDHDHHIAHHIGKAFAAAHGRSHEGLLGGSTAPEVSGMQDRPVMPAGGAGNDAPYDQSEQ